MKITMKKSFAVIMALVMCVSVLFGMNLSVFAADTNTVTYVKNGSYVYNWGQRETEATFLSPMALEFYGENNISLDALLALNGSSTESGVPSSALYKELQSIMKDNQSFQTSYEGTKNLFQYTDCQNSGGAISSFYSGLSVGPTWDNSFNREHTWPNSKGDLSGNGENDIMMLRPTSTSENSSRGNKAYGTTTTTQYYNPNDEGNGAYDLRGDVARIVLYVYVRWGCTNTGSDYNPNGIFGADGVIESQDVLLDWIEADPVDTWELGRNDAVEAITGTRNVFVDYPELAFDLFNETVPTNYTSPSGGTSVEGTTGTGGTTGNGSTDGETGEGTHYVKVTTAPTDWSGDYLIVYETGKKAFNGSLTSLKTANATDVTINDNKIEATDAMKAIQFKIASTTGGYTVKSASGYYIGRTSANTDSNDLLFSNSTEYVNAISMSGSDVNMVSGNTYLRWNNSSSFFRYYRSSTYTGQAAIALYKLSAVEGGETPDPEEPTPDPEEPDEPTGGTPTEETVTISFATTAQRVSQDGNAQIWSNNDLTFTNNKAASSNAVVSNVNPIRVYANSSVTVEHATGTIKSITFAASGSSYVTPLQNSVKTISGATVTTSGNNVTATFSTPVETCTIAKVTAQVRLTSVTATVLIPSGGADATITAQSSNNAHGTVEVSGKYITATPNEGYEVTGYEIVSGTATVTQNGNNFTVEADADVTIKINFAPRTQYTVTFKEQGTTTSTQTAYSGDQITLPAITAGDYTVAGWVTATIDGETTEKPTFYTVGSKYTVTANTTLYALYSRTAAGGGGESNVFTKYTGTITEGDYLIVSDGYAMQAGVSSNRFTQSSVGTADSIDNPAAALIWTVTADGSYYTLYNESTGKYAAGTGTKNQGKLATTVDDYARWTVSGTATYEIVNKGNSAKSVNANIRRNGTYGFATYATSTGKALTLYKRTAAALTTYYFTGAAVADYTVTANANDDTFGTVQVSGTTISATPNAGYIVAGYSIVSGTATVVQEGNTFFVTPTSDVEITINFEALPTYTVTFVVNGEEVDSETTYSGGFIKLPEYSGDLDEYTTFDGWAEKENETDATKIYAEKATFAVTKNVTLYAQFTVTTPPVVESDHYFVKVTEDQTDWTGTYLIVYEAGNIAFNGAMADKLDAVSNGVGVTIADGKIAATDANIAISFVVEKIEGGYNIRSKSGLNFGSESDTNSLLSNATKTYFNNFAIDADGNTTVTGEGGAILRYNATSGQDRFRFYKTGSYAAQKPIALYKLDVADITGAQVTIGSDFTLKYYVDATNISNISDGDLTMRFSIDGAVVDTVLGTVVDGQYVFAFAGLSPQRMVDIIKAEILYKSTLIDVKDNYSIKSNAQNLLTANSDNAELCQFITDMLYYGAAAQKYTKYNTDNLATDGIIGLGTPLDEALTEDYNKFNLTSTTGDAGFKSASVWFDVTNKLIVKVSKKTEDTAVKVYATELGGTRTELVYNSDLGGYMTDEIKVIDFNTTYTFELCDASNNVIQTLTYSVNSYAYSKQNSTNTNMAELALALFRLGQSAENL